MSPSALAHTDTDTDTDTDTGTGLGSGLVPNRIIFVWFGDRLPFWALVALRSAARLCRPEQILLVHRGLSPNRPGVAEALAEPRVELVEFDPSWLRALPHGPAMLATFEQLRAPAAMANLARLALLWTFGGVYLDTDTITVRDLTPLRRAARDMGRSPSDPLSSDPSFSHGAPYGFCGLETLCLPAQHVDGPRLGRLAIGPALAARALCARLPQGERLFRHLEPSYPRAVNNAVLATTAGHPLLARAFETIAAMHKSERLQRYKLGTHLLQDITRNQSSSTFEILAPTCFYPLGPVIARHWFSAGSANRLGGIMTPETSVVHWYASQRIHFACDYGRASARFDRSWVVRERHQIALARLAANYLS